jgi:hypothetical protein
MNSTLYKRKDAIKSALEEIVRKMGLENFTTENAKQKIKSLTLSLSLSLSLSEEKKERPTSKNHIKLKNL